jgi:hypothetical protein
VPPYLPEGRGVKPSFLARVHTRGNPRIRPGSNVDVVASLLEGVVWYAALQSVRSVVEIFGELRDIFVFRRSVLFNIPCSFLSFMFSLGRPCGDAPASCTGLLLY